ncbi:MAG: hypothetical protein AAGG38_06275 [Planctomycetota bacterium]
MQRNKGFAHLDKTQAMSALLSIANRIEKVYALVPEHLDHELAPLQDDICDHFDEIQANALHEVGGSREKPPFESALTSLLCSLEEFAGAEAVLEAERYELCMVVRLTKAGEVARVSFDPDILADIEHRVVASSMALTAQEVWHRQRIEAEAGAEQTKQTQEGSHAVDK